jgi:hypothetical protein
MPQSGSISKINKRFEIAIYTHLFKVTVHNLQQL